MLPDPTNGDSKSASQEEVPEAKKPKLVEDLPVTVAAPSTAGAKAVVTNAIIDDGEVVAVPKSKPTLSASSLPKSAEELNPDLIDDGRDICRYDEECTRKNPVHFKQLRHPKLFEARLQEAKAAAGDKGPIIHTYAGPVAPTMRRSGSSGVGLTIADVSKTTVRAGLIPISFDSSCFLSTS